MLLQVIYRNFKIAISLNLPRKWKADVGMSKVSFFFFRNKCMFRRCTELEDCYGCSCWLHRYVFSSVLICVQLMSLDTYSLSYGNVIPDVAFSCRLPGFLYHIMIPSALPRCHMYTPTRHTPNIWVLIFLFLQKSWIGVVVFFVVVFRTWFASLAK